MNNSAARYLCTWRFGYDEKRLATQKTTLYHLLPVETYHRKIGRTVLTLALVLTAVCVANTPVASAAPVITTLVSTGSIGTYNSIAIGSDNLPIISYDSSIDFALRTVHCGNTTCTAGNTIASIDTGGVGQHTDIAIGTDNLPIISYYDYISFGTLKVAHCGNNTCTSGNTISSLTFGFNIGQYTSIAIGSDNLPIISFFDGSTSDLNVAHCTVADCSGAGISTVDSTGNVGWYTSIAIGSDNLPIVSYYDSTNGNLKVAHCGNVSCSSGNTITTLDSTGDVGSYTSIAIGSDTFPVISYYDTTNQDLKVVHCGNASCSSGNTITTVDSTGNVGSYTSIKKGADNLPVISYTDVTNGSMKVAHCGTADCTTGNTLTAVDSPTGFIYTSLAINANNYPIISYHDSSNQDLKAAACDNYFCDLSGGGNEAPFFSPWSLAILGVGIFAYFKREQLLFIYD